MNYTKAQIERAIGDRFIEWFNSQIGSNFVFLRHGDDPPDLMYVNGERILPIEIVEAYLDERDAAAQWQIRRKKQHITTWSGTTPDGQLLKFIQSQIDKKCRKPYAPDCVLVVYTRPSLTTAEDLEVMLPELTLPGEIPFAGIYLLGLVLQRRTNQVEYRAWKLYERIP